jgi:hypothetical protein
MLAACMALVVALGGVSYAATVLPKNSVGTAQLKKNAVVSKKVTDHSLLARDFKAGQLPTGRRGPQGDVGASGPRGPQGDVGATGPKGDKGDVGPSTAFSAGDNNLLAATTGSEQTLVTLNLPAGAFALFAKVLADNNSGTSRADLSCHLDAGGTVVDFPNTLRLGIESSSTSDRGFYVATGTATLPAPSAATLSCTTSSDVHYFRRAITAVQVGAIG